MKKRLAAFIAAGAIGYAAMTAPATIATGIAVLACVSLMAWIGYRIENNK